MGWWCVAEIIARVLLASYAARGVAAPRRTQGVWLRRRALRPIGLGREQAKTPAGVFRRTRRADGHQAGHLQAGIAAACHQPLGLLRGATAPPRNTGDVHLHQHPGARCPPGDLGGQPRAVHALPEADQTGDPADLVALEPADEVPAGRDCGPPPGAQVPGLGEQFLGIVLADIDEAGFCGRGDRLGAEALGHRHDLHPLAPG